MTSGPSELARQGTGCWICRRNATFSSAKYGFEFGSAPFDLCVHRSLIDCQSSWRVPQMFEAVFGSRNEPSSLGLTGVAAPLHCTRPTGSPVGLFFSAPACLRRFLRILADFAKRGDQARHRHISLSPGHLSVRPVPQERPEVRKGRQPHPNKSTTYARTDQAVDFWHG